MTRLRILFGINLCMLILSAQATLWQPKGWYFYEASIKKNRQPDQHRQLSLTLSDQVILRRVAHIRQQVKAARARAVLFPTSDNIRQYILLQNTQSRRAGRFAIAWQRELLHHPWLDYSQQHPTRSVVQHIYHIKAQEAIEDALKAFAKTQGLFFFFKGGCPYCQQFSPVLKQLVTDYHIAVIPISLDGGRLPAFPQAKRDTGQRRLFHVQATPAVFAVNPHTHRATPVSYGWVSLQTLRRRLAHIVTTGSPL